MSFLMSESPVEASPEQAPVEVPAEEAVEEPVEMVLLRENVRPMFVRRKPSPEEVWDCIRTMETEDVKVTMERKRLIPRIEEINAVRNVLLNDPLLDPVLAQKIREGARVGFCRLGDLSNEQIKERFRQPLDYLKCSTPFPMLTLPLPFKDIPSIDRAYYEGMLTQARDTYAVCMEQLKYVMNIGNEQVYHHVKQAEALKDDPEKQTEYQAQWTKADEIYRSLSKINKVILWMRNTNTLSILESFTQPGFLETPSSE